MDLWRNPVIRVVPSFGRDVKPVVPLVLFDRSRLRAGTGFPLLAFKTRSATNKVQNDAKPNAFALNVLKMRRPCVVFVLTLLFATTQSATLTNQTNSNSTLIDSKLVPIHSAQSTFPSLENSTVIAVTISENISENSTDSELLNYSANHTFDASGVLLEEENEVDRSFGTLDELTTTDHASIKNPSSVETKQTSDPHNFSTQPSTSAVDPNANPQEVRFKSGINHNGDLILKSPFKANSVTETNSNPRETAEFSAETTDESTTTVNFESGTNVLTVNTISGRNDDENNAGFKSSTDVNSAAGRYGSNLPTGLTTQSEIDTNVTGLYLGVIKENDFAGTVTGYISDVPQSDQSHESHTFTEVEQGTTSSGEHDSKITGEVQNVVRSPYNRSTVDLLYEISLNRTRSSYGGAKHFGTVLKRPEDRNNRHASGLFASRSHTEPNEQVKNSTTSLDWTQDYSHVTEVAEFGSGFSARSATSESWQDSDKDVVNSKKGTRGGIVGESHAEGGESAKEQQKSVFTANISEVQGGTSHVGVDKSDTVKGNGGLTVPKSDNRIEVDAESNVIVSKSVQEEERRFFNVANMENRAETEFKRVNTTDNKVVMDDGDHIPWPVKREAVMEGDLVLGGLMMVHEREDTVTCGPVMPQGGVQAVETMLYTLDVINARAILPGVKLGAHVLDDCDKDTYGLEMAVDFIKGSISNIDDAEYHCNKTQVRKVISGVVGAASSVTSIQVANLLRLFRIPQVSFFSTSPELSNKQRFEFFTRTIPSDHYQVKAMVEIVLLMSWSYVSIIYEESNYGIKAFEELETLLGKHEVCIAVKEKLVKDSGVAEETAYDNIVLKLLTKPRARGVIIFGSDQEVAGVMRAVRRTNATGSFTWIGSDGWSARSLVSDGNEAEVEGTLSVQPQANPVKGFQEYFLGLTVENNRRNPWFVEFWEDHFHCRYPNSSRTPYNQKYTSACTTKEQLTLNETAFEDQLQFVSDAVLAFGYALKAMHQDLCQGLPGLCDAMKPTKGTDLLRYLRKVEFEGLSGDMFRFDRSGDGPARYNIIHFKQVSPGQYQWIRVGEYLDGELRLNMSEVQFRLGRPAAPESVCSLPCHQGQAKKYVEGESCCWHCFNCTQYQIRHPLDETQCIPCQDGTLPDVGRVRCEDIPEVFLRTESGWAIGAMSLSASGILVTLFVCAVFARHHNSPVVRASGRELSYVLLTGILLCYSVTFLLVLRPSDVVCGVQRFSTGFCFTVVYASLLTKTNRIARIFNAGKRTAKRPSFISPRSQLLICAGLVLVQVLINGAWMLLSPPHAIHHYPTREDNHLVCSSHIDASYMIAFGYPIILIVVCTLYAVLTRKIPEAFNESKHIGFTMYTTCIIWLAFVPLYFGTGNHVPLRITSMSVTISLSASVTLVCLFSPKLYIILIRPERNVRQSMMPSKVRFGPVKGVGAVTGTTQSGSMMAAVVTAAATNQHALCPPGMLISATSGDTKQNLGVDVELRQDPLSKRNGVTFSSVDRSTQTPTPEENGLATPVTNATPL